jgi:hypothetical protein
MPRLSEHQQQLISTLANPLQPRQRDEFFARLNAELATLPVLGDGMLYRLAAELQKQMLDPPLLDGVDD